MYKSDWSDWVIEHKRGIVISVNPRVFDRTGPTRLL